MPSPRLTSGHGLSNCPPLACLQACNKTFEVRRSEAADGKGRPSATMGRKQYLRMFLKLGAGEELRIRLNSVEHFIRSEIRS